MNNNDYTKADERIKAMIESHEIPESLEPDEISLLLKERGEKKRRDALIHRRRRITAASTAAVIALACIGIIPNVIKQSNDKMEYDTLEIYSNYEDVYTKLEKASRPKKQPINIDDLFDGIFAKTDRDVRLGNSEKVMQESGLSTGGEEKHIGADSDTVGHSDTLNQVEGIEEADIVKTDGKNIYYITNKALYSIPASDGEIGEPKILSKFDESAFYSSKEMLFLNGRIALVYSSAESVTISENGMESSVIYDHRSNLTTSIEVFSAQSGEILDRYTQEGNFYDIRMDDGIIYIVTCSSRFNYSERKEDDYSTYVPSYSDSNGEQYIEPQNIAIPNRIIDYSYSIIGSLDINNPSEAKEVVAVAGNPDAIYMSESAIYVASAVYDYDGSSTSITKISCDDGSMEIASDAVLNGSVLNQFSMDEYEGMFRIALTYFSQNTSASGVYILDNNMKQIGFVGGLGIDETIKSVSFSGDKAYVVTFKETDPLYAIDLSDPKKPVVTDELKITGFSTYMHQWSDNLLLGIGIEANETGMTTGIKLSMFSKNNDGTLGEVGYVGFIQNDQEYYYSAAVGERKALFIDCERNLIALPLIKGSYNDSQKSMRNQYIIFSYENGEFVEQGRIAFSSNDSSEMFNRMVRIGNYLYAMSSNRIVSYNISEKMVSNFAELS